MLGTKHKAVVFDCAVKQNLNDLFNGFLKWFNEILMFPQTSLCSSKTSLNILN